MLLTLRAEQTATAVRVTLLQTDIAWADGEANRLHCDRLIADLKEKPDLLVLPEMFSTGFATNPEGIAERGEEPASLGWMRQKAGELGCAVAGSVATEPQAGEFRNRFFFVKPSGETTYYDKHHLFTYSGEHLRFSRGERRVVVEWQGWRVLLQVCYDLRFPVFSRNREDYDLALYVASWPESRRDAWSILLRARAIENQCYVVGLNRVGSDPSCVYSGDSAIVSPKGAVLAGSTGPTEQVLTACLSMDELARFRTKFPVLKDRDTGSLCENDKL